MSIYIFRFSALLAAFFVKFGSVFFFPESTAVSILSGVISVGFLWLTFSPIKQKINSVYEGA